MAIGGLKGPSGRSEQRVTRALSASAILPTFAIAALGTVTVLVVAMLGMSPMGSAVGPSTRDGAVTTPRMTVSMVPPFVHRSAPTGDRVPARIGGAQTVTVAAVDVPSPPDLLAAASAVQVSSRAQVATPVSAAPSPALAPAPAPARAAGAETQQESGEEATLDSGVAQPFSQASSFTEEQVLAVDKRAEDSSRQAAVRRESAGSTEPHKAAKDSRSARGSRADREDRADGHDRASGSHRTTWRL